MSVKPPERSSTVSVVIAAFADDRWPDTLRAVDSVRHQIQMASEVILVIDHNSRLFQKATKELADVRVVENLHARGASGARNSGVLASSGDLVAFLDDDATAAPDWIARFYTHFKTPAVVGVGGRITPLWEAKAPRWFPEELLWVVGATYRGMPDQVAPVRNVWAGSMMIRREAFDRVGGFRVDFGKKGDREDFQAEDTEFCLRVARAWPAGIWMYDPAAEAMHRVPTRRSSWSFFVRRCYHEGRNKVVLARVVGFEDLGWERRHVLVMLSRGMLRCVRQAFEGDYYGLLRGLNMSIGAGAAILGAMVAKVEGHKQCVPV